MTGRPLPHNLHAERSLLGACLLSREAVTAAAGVVEPRHFYKPSHAIVFDAILQLDAEGERADAVTVAEHIRRAGLADQCGGDAAVLQLQAAASAISAAAQHARIIEELATFRQLIEAGGDIAELGYQTDDLAKTLDEAERIVFNVAERRTTDSIYTLRDSTDHALERLELAFENGGQVTGLPTGYVDFDDLLGGLQPGGLYVVGARPAMGKTAWALGAALHCVLAARQPALFVSLEMSHLELTNRMLVSEARIDASHIRSANLTERDWRQMTGIIDQFRVAPLFIDDNPNATVAGIRSAARKVAARAGRLGLVVVDYVQLMQSAGGNAENRQTEVAAISRGLKVTARELAVPVLALAQLNRGVEQRADKRPMLSDLRESGAIEQDADVVAFLYRDEVYNQASPDAGLAEVIVAKHRNGPTGAVRLAWLAQYAKFVNMARS